MRILNISRVSCLLSVVLVCACQRAPKPETTVASGVGKLAELAPGSFLSPAAGAPVNRVIAGSPVLVLEQGEGWTRVLAADGTFGWTNAPLKAGVPVSIGEGVSVVDQSPDRTEAGNTIELKGEVVVAGASRTAAVASTQQNMFPDERNWLKTPWLKLQAGSASGWTAPSDVSFTWGAELAGKGMIRPPFTGQYKRMLESAPKPGQAVHRVNEAGDTATPGKIGADEIWTDVRSLVTGDLQPVAVLYSSNQTRLLKLTTGSLLFNTYLPELDRAECAPVRNVVQCFAEVTQLTGDGPFTTLWVVTSTGATALGLEASSGEPGGGTTSGTWLLDRDRGVVWIVRADAKSTRTSQVTSMKEAPAKTYAAALSSHDKHEDAVAESIATTRYALSVIPISEDGKIRWTAARLFASSADAEQWKSSVDYGASLRVLTFNP